MSSPNYSETPNKRRKVLQDTSTETNPVFLFVRKSKRTKQAVAPYTSTIARMLDHAEQQVNCNAFIQVKEGYIPTHSIFLCKSNVINQAFSSSMKEREMVFDMTTWNTEIVLDVLEFMYTDSFLHVDNCVDDLFQIFFVVHFLDIPNLSNTLLMEISQLATTALSLSKGVEKEFESKLGLQLLQSDGNFDKQGSGIALFRTLWIVEENKEEFKDIADTVVTNFSHNAFAPEFIAGNEGIAYWTNLSASTLKKILDECLTHCLDFQWRKIYLLITLWTNANPSSRVLQMSSLVNSSCFRHSNFFFNNSRRKSDFFCSNQSMKKFLQIQKSYMKLLETKKKQEDVNWNIMTPFTLYYDDRIVDGKLVLEDFEYPPVSEDIRASYDMIANCMIEMSMNAKHKLEGRKVCLTEGHKCQHAKYPL